VAVAYGGLELVRWLGLDRASDGFEFVIDPLVLAFTAGATLVAAVLAAWLPLVSIARDDFVRVVRDSGRFGGGAPAQRLRGALVIVQVAVSVALLVGAGLLTRSFIELQREGPGFNAENVWTGGIALPRTRYATPESQARFFEQALVGLRALPGVAAVGSTTMLPFGREDARATISVDGYDPPAGAAPPTAEFRSVSDGYFDALGVSPVQGRDFSASESEPVAIVDENLANRYWPGGAALGQRVRNAVVDGWYTVVGVVPHIKHESLRGDPERQTVYWHYRQRPELAGVFAVRSALPPEQLTGAVRAAIARLDPDLALYDVMTMDARIERSLGPQRTPMVLTFVFATIAGTLAIVGIYGVLTWAVTQRSGEIGVRMALGARAADIGRMILKQGGKLISIGLALGVAGALALGRVLSAQVPEVHSFDPIVLALTAAVLGGAALVASWLPARRAARIDPLEALRKE
jgi:predicted permease